MYCRRCNKKIDEEKIYCSVCDELINRIKEFDKLVDENKKLNELESTIEIENLDKLVEEKIEEDVLKEELKDIVKIDKEETKVSKKKNKKTLIIIISIMVLIIAFITILFFVLNKDNSSKKIEKIDYEKVINEYGDSVNIAILDYLKENKKIPSWELISDLIKYDKYDVDCNIHDIYKDGNIYLDKCTVDNETVKYSYGDKQEVLGKEINIYEDKSSYNNEEEGNLIGTITCETEDCEYISAYEKYVLVKEEEKYYIYDYENNSNLFGPFDYIENNILSYENILYAVLYEENGVKNLYTPNTNKTFKNIEGNLLEPSVNFNPEIMYKYGYVIFNNNGNKEFVNLKTGNVSYSINGNLNSFIEDTSKNLVYMTTYNPSNSKITIYNSTGKKLFDGKEFNDMRILDNNIILSTNSNYYIYDSNLKLELTSKDYDKVLGLYNEFVVVVDNSYLEILDLEDNILATFDLKWDSSYTLNNMLSGKVKENNKDIIYLIVESKNKTLKYYYNINTKEYGVK